MTEVANPYRAAIVEQRDNVRPHCHALKSMLDDAVSAMEAGAWIGGKADDLMAGLGHHRTVLHHAAESAIDEFDHAIAGQPRMVDSADWRVHWAKLAQMER